MKRNYDFNDGVLPPCSVNEPHMPVLLLVDTSGSMSGKAISNAELAINRFKSDICKDPKAAERVDICVMAFNESNLYK